jgi:hypothetical protein
MEWTLHPLSGTVEAISMKIVLGWGVYKGEDNLIVRAKDRQHAMHTKGNFNSAGVGVYKGEDNLIVRAKDRQHAMHTKGNFGSEHVILYICKLFIYLDSSKLNVSTKY